MEQDDAKRIKFIGFWPGFEPNNNFIYNSIRKMFPIVLTDNPDYVISGPFSRDYLQYDCIRIFYTGENLCPDFSLFDYAIGFDHISFEDRYLRYPNWAIPEIYGDKVAKMRTKHNDYDNKEYDKRSFCSFVVSKGNGYVSDYREKLFRAISKIDFVASGGRYLNNINCPNGVEDKLEFQKKYKFAIAAENSSCKGYSTEKIVDAFAAGAIPIYWGDSEIGKEFNTKAFINCNEYESLEEVIKAVSEVYTNSEIQDKMMKQPALVNEVDYQKLLDGFLYSIFSQPLSKAYRRDIVGYNKKKDDWMREMEKWHNSRVYKLLGGKRGL